MRTYRFGIIGCGSIAHHHAHSIRETGRGVITAVCDPSLDKARSFAEQYGGARSVTDFRALVKSPDVDIVAIGSPSGSHGEMVVACAEAGKHILCEKPIAITKQGLDDLVQAVEHHGVKMSSVFQKRLAPDFIRIKEAVARGVFGQVFLADAYIKFYRSQEYYDSAGWRGTWEHDGGGALMNQGIHTIDQLLCLAGDAESVFARVGTKARNIEVEDTAVALVQFKSGAYGVIEGTTSVYPGEQARIELHGTNGSVILADSGIKLWAIEDPPVLEDVDLCGNDASTSKDPGNFPKNSHVELIEDLIESIDSGRETLIPAREGRKAVDLILAIYESARTGKEVRL